MLRVAFIVFVLGTALGAMVGVAVGSTGALSRSDWLTYTGAIVGAAVTVFGSLVIIDFQTTSAARRQAMANRELLLALLGDLEVSLNRLDRQIAKGARLDSTLAAVKRRVLAVQGARQWLVPDNAAMIRAYGYIGEMKVTDVRDSLGVFLDARSDSAALRSLAKAAEQNLVGRRAGTPRRLFLGHGHWGRGYLGGGKRT